MTVPLRNPWIGDWAPAPGATVRLFCFPYAGGSASVFRTWKAAYPPSIDVCPIHLPGRGSRWSEPLLDDVRALVAASMAGVQPYFDLPFAFFGHSLGALVSFESAVHVRRHTGAEPIALFVSGCNAAHRPAMMPAIAHLPDAALLDRLRALGGTPAEALAQPELMAMYLPVIRADMAAAERYVYRPESPLTCPITAFIGRGDDETERAAVCDWSALTAGSFTLHELSGGHFFIHSATREMSAAIAAQLRAVARAHSTR